MKDIRTVMPKIDSEILCHVLTWRKTGIYNLRKIWFRPGRIYTAERERDFYSLIRRPPIIIRIFCPLDPHAFVFIPQTHTALQPSLPPHNGSIRASFAGISLPVFTIHRFRMIYWDRQAKGILIEFFSQFQDFVYDPSQSATSEFKRLCKSSGWISSESLLSEVEDDEQTKKRRRAENLFKNALVKQFNSIYGTDEDRLEAWKDLCGRLGVSEIPETLTECRKVVPLILRRAFDTY